MVAAKTILESVTEIQSDYIENLERGYISPELYISGMKHMHALRLMYEPKPTTRTPEYVKFIGVMEDIHDEAQRAQDRFGGECRLLQSFFWQACGVHAAAAEILTDYEFKMFDEAVGDFKANLAGEVLLPLKKASKPRVTPQ